MANETPQLAAEFQALPLEYLIAAPLIGAVKAQHLAALATKEFIEGMIDGDGLPKTVDMTIASNVSGQSKKIDVKAPLLAIVPVPHLRIDNITTHFHFEVTQTLRDTTETSKNVSLEVSSGGLLSPWVSASLKGAIASKSTSESTTNRSGQLDVQVTASQAALPEGLARLLSLMTSAIQLPDSSDESKPKKPKPN